MTDRNPSTNPLTSALAQAPSTSVVEDPSKSEAKTLDFPNIT
jgi:hypothetical protein